MERDWGQAADPPDDAEFSIEDRTEPDAFELDDTQDLVHGGDDGDVDDLDDLDGADPTPDALEEIEALAALEADQLAAARAALDHERTQTRAVLARYRDAILAQEPDLPPDLISGESLEELDASLDAARSAVAGIRARLAEAASRVERGFPVGAPARAATSRVGMSAAEKIRRGLEERVRG